MAHAGGGRRYRERTHPAHCCRPSYAGDQPGMGAQNLDTIEAQIIWTY